MAIKQTISAAAGRLHSRPMSPTEAGAPGLHSLNLEGQRDGLLYVPATYRDDRPIPLVLMLHGAGGNAEGALNMIQEWANAFTAIVLAVDSSQRTWDVIVSRFGADIALIDRALTQTFSCYNIDPNHI